MCLAPGFLWQGGPRQSQSGWLARAGSERHLCARHLQLPHRGEAHRKKVPVSPPKSCPFSCLPVSHEHLIDFTLCVMVMCLSFGQGAAKASGTWKVYLDQPDPVWASVLQYASYVTFAAGHWFVNVSSLDARTQWPQQSISALQCFLSKATFTRTALCFRCLVCSLIQVTASTTLEATSRTMTPMGPMPRPWRQ